MRLTKPDITAEQRTALAAVLEGQVRLGVEENLIHPGDVDHAALVQCYEAGLWAWNVRLPGGCATLTYVGIEALG